MRRHIIAGADIDELDAINWARTLMLKLVFAYPDVDLEKLRREAHVILGSYPDATAVAEMRVVMRHAS